MNGLLKTVVTAAMALAVTNSFGDPFTANGSSNLGIPLGGVQTQNVVTLNARQQDSVPYYLAGTYIVPDGKTLIIRPGTWIFGLSAGNAGAKGSNLLIARGGKLIAEATVDSPIVFTAFGDDFRSPGAFGPGAMGLWGGIFMIGKAGCSMSGVQTVENAPNGTLDSNYMFNYASDTFPHDSSGVLRYVSIRHGGQAENSNSDMDNIDFWGVGDRTVMEYCEVYSGLDDGFEWFGGTMTAKHLVGTMCLEEPFDFDMGWRGKLQFLFGVKKDYEAQRIIEWDSYRGNETSHRPDAGELAKTGYMSDRSGNVKDAAGVPQIWNVTGIGCGSYTNKNTPSFWPRNTGTKQEMISFMDSAVGRFNNMIMVSTGVVPPIYSGAHMSGGRMNTAPMADWNGVLPMQHVEMKRNLFWDFLCYGPGYPTPARLATGGDITALEWGVVSSNYGSNGTTVYGTDAGYLAQDNYIYDPLLRGEGWQQNCHTLDPRPNPSSVALGNGINPVAATGDAWFTAVDYIGAFNGTDLWCSKWTALQEDGILVSEDGDARRTNVNNAHVKLSPASGTRLYSGNPVDIMITWQNLGAGVTVNWALTRIWIDGKEVQAAFPTPVAMADGYVTWLHLNGASIIPAYFGTNPTGPHTIRVDSPMSDGSKLGDASTVYIWTF